MITSWIWFNIPKELEDEDVLEENTVSIKFVETPIYAAACEAAAIAFASLGTNCPMQVE